MGARSLNLRPIYDENDYSAYEQPQRGIAAALQQYAQVADQRRQERNTVAQMGGVETQPAPGPMDRLRGVGRKVRGIADALRSTIPGQADAMAVNRLNATPAPAAPVVTDRYPAQTQAMPMPAGAPLQTPLVADTPRRAGATPYDEVPDATTRPSIGRALANYTYEGASGAKYDIDPTVPAQREAYAKDAIKTRDDNEKIDALVAAGMSPTEARARVLNNVVRYDETFGQQYGRGGRGGSSLTFEQRQALQNDNNRVRLQIARMAAAGRTDSNEFRQLEFEFKRNDAILRSLESEASSAERGLPRPGTESMVAEATPQGKAAVAAGTRAAAGARAAVRVQRGKVAAVGTPKTYSTDPNIKRAQQLWDENPEIQAKRPRPQ